MHRTLRNTTQYIFGHKNSQMAPSDRFIVSQGERFTTATKCERFYRVCKSEKLGDKVV